MLDKFNKVIRPQTPRAVASDFSFFDGSELSYPVVVGDDLARKWLEVNYLFSTGFRPNTRPGAGEIGADIRTEKRNGGKYLTVHVGLLDSVVAALNDYRKFENICAEWLENREKYADQISSLQKEVSSLSGAYSQLKNSINYSKM